MGADTRRAYEKGPHMYYVLHRKLIVRTGYTAICANSRINWDVKFRELESITKAT